MAGRQVISSTLAMEWRVVPATVTGPSHVSQGLGNQDNLIAKAIADRVLVLAVADGAGSREYSDEGSKFAVRAAWHVASACSSFATPGSARSLSVPM
jgi:hypothetical protein